MLSHFALLVGVVLLSSTLPGKGFADAGVLLFEQGIGAEVLLLDGRIRRPAEAFACSGCHGADGGGGREGGTDIPPIGWAILSAPTRADGGYDRAKLLRAVTEGNAADGRRLSDVMPRFDAPEQVLSALADHLEALDTLQRRGVGAASVVVGLPVDRSETSGFLRALAQFNSGGGAFGRAVVPGEADLGLLSYAVLWQTLNDRPTQAAPLLSEAQNTWGGNGADLPDAFLRGYVSGLFLAEALIACGRDVTRGCVLTAVSQLEAAPLIERAPGPSLR